MRETYGTPHDAGGGKARVGRCFQWLFPGSRNLIIKHVKYHGLFWPRRGGAYRIVLYLLNEHYSAGKNESKVQKQLWKTRCLNTLPLRSIRFLAISHTPSGLAV